MHELSNFINLIIKYWKGQSDKVLLTLLTSLSD